MATFYDGPYVGAERANRAQDWANLVIAIWLFISPWVLQLGSAAQPTAGGASPGTASWNAWVMGVLIFLVALSGISRMDVWQEWTNLIFGAWVFIAPWVLGFTRLASASWDHWIVGALVFLIAASTLGATRSAPRTPAEPRTTAERPVSATNIQTPETNRPPWPGPRD